MSRGEYCRYVAAKRMAEQSKVPQVESVSESHQAGGVRLQCVHAVAGPQAAAVAGQVGCDQIEFITFVAAKCVFEGNGRVAKPMQKQHGRSAWPQRGMANKDAV